MAIGWQKGGDSRTEVSWTLPRSAQAPAVFQLGLHTDTWRPQIFGRRVQVSSGYTAFEGLTCLMDNSRLWRFFGVGKYSREPLNSPVAEWLDKRLMSVSSPTQNMNGDYLDATRGKLGGESNSPVVEWLNKGLLTVPSPS